MYSTSGLFVFIARNRILCVLFKRIEMVYSQKCLSIALLDVLCSLFFSYSAPLTAREHGNNSDRLLVFIWKRIRCNKLPQCFCLCFCCWYMSMMNIMNYSIDFTHITMFFCLVFLLDRLVSTSSCITHTCSHYVIVLEYLMAQWKTCERLESEHASMSPFTRTRVHTHTPAHRSRNQRGSR